MSSFQGGIVAFFLLLLLCSYFIRHFDKEKTTPSDIFIEEKIEKKSIIYHH